MYTFWTKGLDEKGKKDFVHDVAAGRNILKKYLGELEKQLERVQKERRAKVNYEYPSWPYLQADITGEERALEHNIDLIKNLTNGD